MDKSKVEIYHVEQGSNAWHEIRCGRITGSKFKDLMSAKSTLGYQKLINNAAGEILTGELEESYKSADMERGNEFEFEAADMYEFETSVNTFELGFVTNIDIHPEYVGVSPDRGVGNGLLEIKCPKKATHIKYLKSGVLPTEYKYQVHGQMLITGAKFCDFMSYYPGIKPFILRVYPDQEIVEKMLARIEDAVKEIKETLEILK